MIFVIIRTNPLTGYFRVDGPADILSYLMSSIQKRESSSIKFNVAEVQGMTMKTISSSSLQNWSGVTSNIINEIKNLGGLLISAVPGEHQLDCYVFRFPVKFSSSSSSSSSSSNLFPFHQNTNNQNHQNGNHQNHQNGTRQTHQNGTRHTSQSVP